MGSCPHAAAPLPPRSRRSRALSLALVAGFGLLLTGDTPAQVATDITEETRARLLFQRIRVESSGKPGTGACSDIRTTDLHVVIRPKPDAPAVPGQRPRRKTVVRGEQSIRLDCRPERTVHALVLDTSASMSTELAEVQRAAVEYVRRLRPEHDRALVATFDESVVLRHGVTEDVAALDRVIGDLRLGGHTSLFDAITLTLRELDSYRDRPVMIVLSDGDDTSSFYDEDHVLDQVRSRPDLVVFTIGIGLRQSATGSARVLLRRMAEATHGKYFELDSASDLEQVYLRIRAILGTEVTVTVVDPDPEAAPAELQVESGRGGFRVTALGSFEDAREKDPRRWPLGPPFPEIPARFATPPTRAYQELFKDAAERRTSGACPADATAYPGPMWVFYTDAARTWGCGPDITREHGMLYRPEGPEPLHKNDRVQIYLRPFEIDVPALDRLPARPEDALSRFIAATPGQAPSQAACDAENGPSPCVWQPMLTHGTAFLEMRPAIARALFHYPDYKRWALGKLHEQAEELLRGLAERYRSQFPGESEAALDAAARYSLEGQRILERAEQPSEIDLQQYLAAWLGDIPAHELFARWEKQRIDRRLGTGPSPSDDDFVAAWRLLRDGFSLPDRARVMALLVPVHDPGCDCIGFWRVVLPRPCLIRPRMREREAPGPPPGIPLDLVADRPLAHGVLERALAAEPGLGAHLRSRGYRVTGLDYQLLGDPARHDPLHAFASTRVVLELAAPGNGQFRLTADLALAPEPAAPQLDALRIDVRNDRELRTLARQARRTLLGEPAAEPDETEAPAVTVPADPAAQ